MNTKIDEPSIYANEDLLERKEDIITVLTEGKRDSIDDMLNKLIEIERKATLMEKELNFLSRISYIDYDIYETTRRTPKNKLIFDMDTIEALYDCQSKEDKEEMPIIGALVAFYKSF